MASKAPPVDKRRQILDAAVRVFARQGFHATRVSDIADEAGVAYGLVYHYFSSKDEVLNELFSRALVAAAGGDRRGRPGAESPRDKLAAVAGFIVDSYRHDPELMKVIIVEVTRAANSFGRTHLPEIRRAYESIAKIVADGQEAGEFPVTSTRCSPRWPSTGRSSSCSRAGSSASSRSPRSTSTRRRHCSWRRSATAWSRDR